MTDFEHEYIDLSEHRRRRESPSPDDDTGFYVPPDAPATAKRPMVLEWFGDACAVALDDGAMPLIHGILDQGAFSVFYGDSNAGKTFVALDMSYAVSRSDSLWNGKTVANGLVIYVAAEGGRRITRRLAALHQAKGDDAGPAPLFALIRHPIDLRSGDADLRELVGLIRKAEAECGAPVTWIIVDTLSRAMAGGDENSSVDMGNVVNAADRIRSETGAHFTFVHHSGKDAARGARGHSLLRAATDTEIEITPGGLRVTKQRDMDCGEEFGFSLIDIELGADSAGTMIRSAIVEWRDAPTAKAPNGKAVPASQRLLMACVIDALEGDGENLRPYGESGPVVHGVADGDVRKIYFERIAEKADPDEDGGKLFDRQRKGFKRSLESALKAQTLMAVDHNGERWIWTP